MKERDPLCVIYSLGEYLLGTYPTSDPLPGAGNTAIPTEPWSLGQVPIRERDERYTRNYTSLPTERTSLAGLRDSEIRTKRLSKKVTFPRLCRWMS